MEIGSRRVCHKQQTRHRARRVGSVNDLTTARRLRTLGCYSLREEQEPAEYARLKAAQNDLRPSEKSDQRITVPTNIPEDTPAFRRPYMDVYRLAERLGDDTRWTAEECVDALFCAVCWKDRALGPEYTMT